MVAAMAELVGGLAHELRNPLSTMMVNLKLLAEDLQDDRTSPEDARRRALLKVAILQQEAERLQNLFDRFLQLTTADLLERVDTDMNGVVSRLVDFFAPSAKSQRIDIELVLCDHPLVCAVDEQAIRQALLNILINAQQAMPDGGTLRVVSAPQGGEARITISDTGIGIAPEDVDRILRPFFSTRARGSGLGLSITQRIVRAHGGSLTFQSDPATGTVFTIHLPRTGPHPARETGTG